MSRPRVLLAEDNPVMAAELHALLEPELELVGTVADGDALLAAADALRPDVIVADIVMPQRSGISATAELRRRYPDTRVVLVSVYDDLAFVLRGRAAGALGHVWKASAARDLVPAIRAALRNETYVSREIPARASGRGAGQQPV
jgi:DNA-binding NarL/FixJ family response regulator